MSDYEYIIGTIEDKRVTVKYLGRKIGKGMYGELDEIVRLHREELREEYPEPRLNKSKARWESNR